MTTGTYEETEEKVYVAIAKVIGQDIERVKERGLETKIIDLGLDSLDIVDVQLNVEENTGISFNDEEFGEKYKKLTIKDLIDYVHKQAVKK